MMGSRIHGDTGNESWACADELVAEGPHGGDRGLLSRCACIATTTTAGARRTTNNKRRTHRIARARELLDGNHELAGVLFLGLCHGGGGGCVRRSSWQAVVRGRRRREDATVAGAGVGRMKGIGGGWGRPAR